MTDEHHTVHCSECGEQPTLVRLGSIEAPEHASWGIECGCSQPDETTPVGSYVEVANVPNTWEVADDA